MNLPKMSHSIVYLTVKRETDRQTDVFKEKYTLQLFAALKITYLYCFSLGGNLDFPDIRQRNL